MNGPPQIIWHHVLWLILGITIPLLALSLTVLEDQQVAFRGFEQYPFPQTCLSVRFFGVSCLGCGMTRSIIHLMHGQPAVSLQFHPLGGLVLLLIIFQIPYRCICLYYGVSKLNWIGKSQSVFWIGLVLLLLLNQIIYWYFV